MSRPEEKTEAATPRRRQEARREGLTVRAPEVSRAFGVAGLLLIGVYVASTISSLITFLTGAFSGASRLPPATFDWAGGQIRNVISGTMGFLLVPLLIAVALSLVGSMLVSGLVMQPLRFHFDRLDPWKGLTRIFSRRSLFELPFSLVKLLVIGGIGGLVWFGIVRQMLQSLIPLSVAVGAVGAGARSLGFALVGAALLLAGGDYLYGRSQYERDIRMTRQELKEEIRRTEGDPLVRVRIRSLMRRRAQQRMMARVKEADVVITNPTHYAVALKYDAAKMKAPEVLAKGRGFIAEKIKEEARQQGVAIVENAPLAQALNRSVEIGRPIPPELFKAVAEVLAYVYRQENRAPGGMKP